MTAPTGHRLKLGHGNGHNKPQLVDFANRAIRRDGCSSVAALEAHRLLRDLDRIPGTRLTAVRHEGAEPRERDRTTAIVTDDRREFLGELTLKVSERVPQIEKFGPARFLVASFYAHPLADQLDAAGVAHFALHPDATVMHHAPDHPLVREYQEALESTRWHMQAAKRDGYLVNLTGDLQATDEWKSAYSPHKLIADPLQLKTRVRHIDWCMADPRLAFARALEVTELFDHPGFVATLRAA